MQIETHFSPKKTIKLWQESDASCPVALLRPLPCPQRRCFELGTLGLLSPNVWFLHTMCFVCIFLYCIRLVWIAYDSLHESRWHTCLWDAICFRFPKTGPLFGTVRARSPSTDCGSTMFHLLGYKEPAAHQSTVNSGPVQISASERPSSADAVQRWCPNRSWRWRVTDHLVVDQNGGFRSPKFRLQYVYYNWSYCASGIGI